jgi:hypothetical protein
MVDKMATKSKFMKNVIYKLKRSFGLPIEYYKINTHSTDLESGIHATTHTRIYISKAVVLRAREFRSFVYDLAYISANKDFTEGGFFDPQDRRVLLDVVDLPLGFNPTVDDYFILNGDKYEIKEILDYGENYTFEMLARKLRGSLKIQIGEPISILELSDSVSQEIIDNLTQSISSSLELTQALYEVP